MMIIAKLALRNLWRDKSAFEVQILLGSLIVAMAASIAISCFGFRLHTAMNLRASEFLAADLALESSSLINDKQQRIITSSNLHHARTAEFATVVITDAAMLLTSVKAVNDEYPLRGKLKSSLQLDGEELVGQIPEQGTLWAESRVLSNLDLNIGDALTLGNKTFIISRILLAEPDRNSDFYSLSPRIIMNYEDLAYSGVIAPGSRVKYRYLVRGDAVSLQQFRDQIQPTLLANQKLLDVKKANNQIGSALDNAQQYLNLATLVAVVLAAVAIALSAAHFAVKRFNDSALLRCLGFTGRQVLIFFCWQLAYLGVTAGLIAIFLGFAAQLGLFYLLQGLIPQDIPITSAAPFVSGIMIGLVSLAGFALPGIMSLSRTPPLRVLRNDLNPYPLNSWLIYILSIATVASIMWYLSLDVRLIAALLASGLSACLIFGLPLFMLIKWLRRVTTNFSLVLRMGLGQLLRRPIAAIGQILAFGLILMCMALMPLLHGELLDDWRNQLPENTPNHFALNITLQELPAFMQHLNEFSPYQSPFYPITMGRLIAINDQKIDPETFKDNAVRRDLNLTFSKELPKDNEITAGSWWDEKNSQQTNQQVINDNNYHISVEEKLAQSLQVTVGDSLTFQIAGKNITAQIMSLRKVDWENFLPNFFIIFADDISQNLAVTYLASFYIPQGNDAKLLELARKFPTTTILPITALLEQIRSIVEQVTIAVEYILMFVLMAGIMVLLAGLQSTLDERIYSSALLRALGAPRKLLRHIRLCEFALLGFFSGLLAVLGAEVICFALYFWLFDMKWSFHLQLLLLPFLGAFLISLVGILGSRQVNRISPLKILRVAA